MITLPDNKFKKIFSALELPMYPDESLDLNTLTALIDYEISIGAEGFYCMGSSGEALLLSLIHIYSALRLLQSFV